MTRVRVAVASRLLAHTYTKLDGIAQVSGFTDASHLSRVFTERMGIRPGEYRRRSYGTD